MAVTLQVLWLAGAYEASFPPGEPEWPPHPARSFCSLVSTAEPGSDDDKALRWLEEQAPPTVLAPPAAEAPVRQGFVPTNARAKPSGPHQQYLGRTAGARSWARVVPARSLVRMTWAADPSDEVLGTLDRLARRVPYLGRSTSPALLSFRRGLSDGEQLIRYQASPRGRRRLRVPYPGYLEALRHAHADGEPPWSAERTVPYEEEQEEARDESEPTLAPAEAPYPDLLILAFPPGVGVDGRHTGAVASAFKAAVLQRLGAPTTEDPWERLDEERLSLLHGHHEGIQRQCAFLALPFVGHRRATGEVLGVGVALSPGLDPDVRTALLRLAGRDRDEDPRLDRLHVPGLGSFPLKAADARISVSAARWSGPATRWATVTPAVLDWWPKRRLPVEEVVARGCEAAGYARPASVEVVRSSVVPGAPFVPRAALTRRTGEALPPAVHARLSFEAPVPGPVVVGRLRHLGLGLCLPWEGS